MFHALVAVKEKAGCANTALQFWRLQSHLVMDLVALPVHSAHGWTHFFKGGGAAL